ncbi:MAG TPA: hypothetical protein PK163_10830 [Steroidobacteraceae bacterium]|nr:hypothetical protein [Steroidobacteraceae bacterium]
MEPFIVAAVALGVALGAFARSRRHAARRAAEERERARRRRRTLPLVSANVRGLPQEREDLWKADPPVRKDRVA